MMKRQPSAKNNLPPTKVVNIPLLFKNCSIEVSTPSRKLIEPRSSRGASSVSKGTKATEKSSSKKMTPRGWGVAATNDNRTANKRQTINGKKIVKIDLKRNPSKQKLEQPCKPVELETTSRDWDCKQHSRLKTSLPTKSSLPTEPSEAVCLTERTLTQHTLNQTQMPLRKPTRVSSSQNLRAGENDEISTEMSCEAISQVKISELHELRERFIKKRSEVYQVLCNLDTKFERLDKEQRLPTALREVDTNGKKQLVSMLKQRTSPRSPALFTHGANHPINSLLIGKRNQEVNATRRQQQ